MENVNINNNPAPVLYIYTNTLSYEILKKINETLSLRDKIVYEEDMISLYELDGQTLSALEYIAVEFDTEIYTEEVYPETQSVVKTMVHPKHGCLSRRVQ